MISPTSATSSTSVTRSGAGRSCTLRLAPSMCVSCAWGANFTASGLKQRNNDLLVIEDAGAVGRFEGKFERV